MYRLTPETLIRIEDAADPKRGFITKPWEEIMGHMDIISADYIATGLMDGQGLTWNGFRFWHPEAITEV